MKKQVKISPEKYIVTKSRSLPIYKCYLIGDYKTEGKCQVIISRKHKTGKITTCFYLIDLWCLGVKDSFYRFNIDEDEFDEMINDVLDNSGLDAFLVDYNTAHNIIFAGYEYALDLDIKAYKDFENITKYFLEEDDDNIPLIDIECGKDGKPFYEQGEESHAQAMKFIRILEKSVGKDNFDYMLSSYSDEDDNESIKSLFDNDLIEWKG